METAFVRFGLALFDTPVIKQQRTGLCQNSNCPFKQPLFFHQVKLHNFIFIMFAFLYKVYRIMTFQF